MDFRITEDLAALTAAVRDYLGDRHKPELLRTLNASESRRSDAVWQGLVEMGLTGLLVPEAQGGLGLSLLAGVAVAIELGRACVAEPLADTALVAVPLLVAASGQERLLGEIASGVARVALNHPVNPWVADLDQATHILVADEQALRLAIALPSRGPLESIDPLRRLAKPQLFQAASIGGTATALLDHAALVTAAQALGLAEAMLAMSTEYAGTRNQFGQPIGSFQAVKHHLASAAVKIAFARPVVDRAAVALGEGHAHASIHVSHAKLVSADAASAMAETAIQIHGAMGYTYEVDLHFWMKRAWALAGAWGNRGFHLHRIDAAVIGGKIPIGPAHTFA